MNKFKIYFFLLIFISSVSLIKNSACAQTVPAFTKDTNIDDYSDAEIKSYLQQAQQAGYTDDQIVQLASKNGLSQSQIQKLQTRIADIRRKDGGQTANGANFTDTTGGNRKFNQRDTIQNASRRATVRDTTPQIFGASLFRNTGTNSFAPNLNIATPVNYIVGPRDQLQINVYGRSVNNWTLTVSPEGNINIPNVGVIHVAGHTIEQVTSLIKAKLSTFNYAIDKGTSVSVNLGNNIRTIQVVLQGQFVKPGSFSVPSLTDAYAALFAGGGPNDFGSFRKIEIIRNNQIVSRVDLYEFLTKGTKKGDITLKDQDVIRIPTYDVRVLLSGQIKIPGFFEVLPGESLQDILNFAGGFTDQAYTSRIQTIQINDQQRRIHDVFEGQFGTYIPKRGDKFIIGRVLDRFENRVSIKGAIFKPADYELTDGLTVSQLIKNAGGLKEDAFTGRGSIIRLKPDNTKEQLSFSIADAMANKPGADIILKREDEVTVSSIFDLRDRYKISIKGEVRKPGDFDYADSIKVADLIIRAGGFSEGASTKRLEVTRRVYDSDPHTKDSKVATVYTVNINGALRYGDADFTLKPYDIVSVYSLPGFEIQKTVRVSGEVIFPGPYGIEKKNEKISDIIARAGGLTASADIDGASLKRDNNSAMSTSKNKIDSAELNREQATRLNRLKRTYKDSTNTDTSQLRNNFVGIDLKYIMQHPGSSEDLILENGDELRVPKQQQTVKVNGEVLFPSAVVYNSAKSFQDYVLNAGGFSPQALKRGAYVVYPNGTVKGTRKFLFFNVHPKVKPGSELFVPKKPEPKNNVGQQILGYATGLASIGAIILGIITVSK